MHLPTSSEHVVANELQSLIIWQQVPATEMNWTGTMIPYIKESSALAAA